MLASLGLIRVSGNDRAQFLQGQITQDVGLADANRSALFGWTNAQGRLLVTGQLMAWRDSCWLTAPAGMIDGLVGRLRIFVLRAKVTVEASDLRLIGLADGSAGELPVFGRLLRKDPLAFVGAEDWCATRVGGDAGRVLLLAENPESLPVPPGAQEMGESEWRMADIRAGLPSIVPATAEKFIPQMVNLDLIGGVSFSKGCYAGQEIITRTRHLGRVKRRMLRFRCAGPARMSAGDQIYAADREAGVVVSAEATADGVELLAVTPLDAAAESLFADPDRQRPLQRLDLPYPVIA